MLSLASFRCPNISNAARRPSSFLAKQNLQVASYMIDHAGDDPTSSLSRALPTSPPSGKIGHSSPASVSSARRQFRNGGCDPPASIDREFRSKNLFTPNFNVAETKYPGYVSIARALVRTVDVDDGGCFSTSFLESVSRHRKQPEKFGRQISSAEVHKRKCAKATAARVRCLRNPRRDSALVASKLYANFRHSLLLWVMLFIVFSLLLFLSIVIYARSS